MKMYELEVRDSFGLRTSLWIVARSQEHAEEQQEHFSCILEENEKIKLSISGSTFVAAGDSYYTGN